MSEQSSAERIGAAAMDFIDHVRADYGEEARLEVVAIVGAVRFIREDGEEHVRVTYFCEDDRRFAQRGLLADAADVARWGEVCDHDED